MMPSSPDQPFVSNLEQFRRLIRPGVIGDFTHCELTEIFANIEGISGPQNVFTLAVTEERGVAAPPKLLNSKRLLLKGLRGWSLGICRTLMMLPDFEQGLAQFDATGIWSPAGNALATGAIRQPGPQFVPADWADSIPLNKVLKNNFWAGSHVLEWTDPKKRLFKPLFDKASFLKELAELLLPFVPIDLAAVSDRLGNILVQVPVEVLIASCEPSRDNSGYDLQVAWSPEAKQRPLRATMVAEYDRTVTGFANTLVTNKPAKLPFAKDANEPRVFLLDEEHDVLVGATAPLSWFSQVGVTTHAVGHDEPRFFSYLDRFGQTQSRSITLRGSKQEVLVGQPLKDANGGFTQKRLYRYDTERVQKERLFKQYGLRGCDPKAEYARAIADLRHLIGLHGEEGAWLWDPFLDAIGIMETLFHSPHGNTDLRALGTGAGRKHSSISAYMTNQGRILDLIPGNFLELRLEYRVSYRVQSARFHDRFLIFPTKQGAHLAWSLGTSINSLGQAHHILQRVDDGQRVSDAFQDLWGRMGPAQLVWKKP